MLYKRRDAVSILTAPFPIFEVQFFADPDLNPVLLYSPNLSDRLHAILSELKRHNLSNVSSIIF